jgi:hypothetical protein
VSVRPGIYLRGQVEYEKIDAINYSTLKEMAKSPLHYLYALKHGRRATAAMNRGTAAHIAVLEPERFATDYLIWEGRRAGKAWEAFEADAQARGKQILKDSELALALAIRDAVRGHAKASSYLVGGHAEVTIVWEDEETGLLCKGRLDFLRDDGTPADLKTTRNIEQFWFSRDLATNQYHVQAAMYLDGAASLTRKQSDRFALIAVEGAAPHDVVPYLLHEDVTGPGRDAYRALLRRVKECRESGEWPGYANGSEMTIALPAWATGDAENDLSALGLE